MAETMQFDLVSPERRLASLAAREVQIPGMEGDLTAMPDHAPTITTLRPGLLRVVHGGGTDEYVVVGGFAEITQTGVSVLAEQALPRGEVTQEIFDALVDDMKQSHAAAAERAKAEDAPGDDAAKLLADLMGLGGQIGLTPKG